MLDIKKINADLQKAMKKKDALRLETLRMMKSKIEVVNPRGDLPEKEIIKILSTYAKQLKDTIEQAKKVNRPKAAEKTAKELVIVQEYLPKQLSPEETKTIAQKVIADLGAESMKDMGKVMKEIMANNPGADGATVKNVVSELLKS